MPTYSPHLIRNQTLNIMISPIQGLSKLYYYEEIIHGLPVAWRATFLKKKSEGGENYLQLKFVIYQVSQLAFSSSRRALKDQFYISLMIHMGWAWFWLSGMLAGSEPEYPALKLNSLGLAKLCPRSDPPDEHLLVDGNGGWFNQGREIFKWGLAHLSLISPRSNPSIVATHMSTYLHEQKVSI